MSKRKGRKHSHSKGRKRPGISKPKLTNFSVRYFLSRISTGWKIFLIVTTLVGFISAIYAFYPRITVSSLAALDPNAPFSTPFTIGNEGRLPITNVEFQCAIGNVVIKNTVNGGPDVTLEGAENFGARFVTSNRVAARVDAGEKYTVICPWPIENSHPIKSADIAIVVIFKLQWVPMWRQERFFRFTTMPDSDGKLHWLPQPLSKMRRGDG